jgi:hypothetical protein
MPETSDFIRLASFTLAIERAIRQVSINFSVLLKLREFYTA